MKDHYKNIVVLVSLDSQTSDDLKGLSAHPFLKETDNVYFLNIFNKRSEKHLPLNIDTKNREQVEEYITGVLKDIREATVNGHQNKNSTKHSRVFFDNNDKNRVLEYLSEIDADLVIVTTRGEQGVEGIFADSYSYWLVAHAPCDVFVIRPKN
jgi:nucleotide-binding universal stress UspA family protein